MKIVTTFLLVILTLFSMAQNNVSIKCVFTDSVAKDEIIIENYVNPAAFSQKVVIENNAFIVDIPVETEDIYKLKFDDDNFLAMIIAPKEKILLKLNSNSLGMNPEIKGSPSTSKLYETQGVVNFYAMKMDSLNKKYQMTSTDVERLQIEKLYSEINNDCSNYIVKSISDNINSLVTMFFIDNLNIDEHFQLYRKLDSALMVKYSNNLVVLGLHNKVKSAKGVFIGEVAPDINMKDPENKNKSLHEIKKSKIIIIDFWASWCRPCRMENSNMTKLYSDYHEKGLEIFGVSLDKDLESWKKAIENDKLIWHHVSDLKGWSNAASKMYGVASIPSMFVIDGTTYKILAKDLRGESLRQFISSKLD